MQNFIAVEPEAPLRHRKPSMRAKAELWDRDERQRGIIVDSLQGLSKALTESKPNMDEFQVERADKLISSIAENSVTGIDLMYVMVFLRDVYPVELALAHVFCCMMKLHNGYGYGY